MSATADSTDSNLSGKPSDDIDKQKGPLSGGNVESADSTLPGATKSAENGQNQASPGSNRQDGSSETKEQSTQQHTNPSSS